MRIRNQKDGSLALRMSGNEALVYGALAAELRAHVENPDFNSRAARHLFPRYADDEKTNNELRGLLFEDQRRQKLERVDAFAAAMAKIPAHGGEVTLARQELENWIALLTDLRFIYASAIGIEDDHWEESLDPLKPLSREVSIYLHLSSLQQALLDRGFDIEPEPRWREN